jgi:hypothetical protein
MGGGFTYTVHALQPPAGEAGLTLAIAKNAMGPSGGPVDLTAATTDGSPATDLTWYFIADAVTEETDPAPMPVASPSRAPQNTKALRSQSAVGGAAAAGGGRFPAQGQRVRAISAQTGDTTITTNIHTLPAGDYLFLSADSLGTGVAAESAAAPFAAPSTTPAGMRMTPSTGAPATRQLAPSAMRASVGSTAPYDDPQTLPPPITGSTILDGCAGSLTCSVNLKVEGGTFVVTGVVGGVLRAAEQRVAALPEDPTNKVSIQIVRAEGPNSKSFTYARAERKIVLEASVSPADLAPTVKWEVLDASGDRVAAIPPATAPTGALTSFNLPKHPRDRWPTDHPGAMDRKPIRYQVTATVTNDGKVYKSDPVIVGQDLVDTIREEYYEFDLTELGRRIPGRGDFAPSPSVGTGQAGANNADISDRRDEGREGSPAMARASVLISHSPSPS